MKPLALDAADIRILSAVQQYGRLSKSKLAELVNLSPTPCWARLKKLTDAGLVKTYNAEIALEKLLDVTEVIVTVSLNKHRKYDFERFEKYVKAQHEITSCRATGGGMDYVMTIVTTSLPAFQALMTNMLESELEIDRYFTYIVTRRVKSSPPDISKLLKNVDYLV